jgi:hypothetical protein
MEIRAITRHFSQGDIACAYGIVTGVPVLRAT